MYRRILVTGSAGVLGSAVRAIQSDYPGCEFVFATRQDCDLRNAADALEHVTRTAPDAILHLAAVSGGVGLSLRYPATLLRDNVLMTIGMLEAARRARVRKLVMTLSSGMYAPTVALPIKEASIHDGPAHESNYGYAYAKRLIEPAIRAYRTEYGLNVVGLVPNGIFGENDDFGRQSASMPAALMRRFYEGRHGTAPLTVWGDGSPLRELTYSEDMARAFMWALFHYEAAEILNVGTAVEVSVRDLAFMIADELGVDRRRIVFDPSRPRGVHRKSTDTSRFAQLSGLEFTPFRVALKRTLAWLDEHYGPVTAGDRSEGRPEP